MSEQDIRVNAAVLSDVAIETLKEGVNKKDHDKAETLIRASAMILTQFFVDVHRIADAMEIIAQTRNEEKESRR